jgi:hypothetical protein
LKQELNINRSKVSCKGDRLAQDETEKDAKRKQECGYRLNQIPTSDCYTALLEDESED